MTEIQLEGSGGWVKADLTDEQVKESKLVPNMEKYFLGKLEKLDTTKMIKHLMNLPFGEKWEKGHISTGPGCS